ncbi:MAG: anthranilate synthase component I family protein, partial [Haliangium ochraceum]
GVAVLGRAVHAAFPVGGAGAAAHARVIATPGPFLAAAEAARRLETGFWLSSPGAARGASRELVGGPPVGVIEGRSPSDLASLEEAWREARARWADKGAVPAGLPVAVGWLSYELGRRLVGLPADPRTAGAPLFSFQFPDAVWVRGDSGDATLLARDPRAAGRLRDRLLQPRGRALAPALGPLSPVDPPAAFVAGVRQILAYEAAGDAYQVNLSRRLTAAWSGEPAHIAALLRAAAPAPYATFIADGSGGALFGNSPERFLALDADGLVETRPIKGTRPRGASPAEDHAAIAALRASPKDRAEHVMIVDLERNDLGRICRPGTVEVATLARVISLPTVHHLESTVRGVLRPGVGLAALVGATFPGGSITGAPKRRAMQIIDELESGPRGVYTGATGWLGAAGDLDLAVAIRTAILREGRLELSVGGGIVIESTPEGELAETEVKARAFASLAGAAAPA